MSKLIHDEEIKPLEITCELEQKKLKASEILKTTKIEQCFGTLREGNKRCAIGALVTDSNGDFGNITLALMGTGLDLRSVYRNCPKCDHACSRIEHMIIHLNDIHGAPFKEIGAWLESIGA